MFSIFIVVPGENAYGNRQLFTACWDALHLYYKSGLWNEDTAVVRWTVKVAR